MKKKKRKTNHGKKMVVFSFLLKIKYKIKKYIY